MLFVTAVLHPHTGPPSEEQGEFYFATYKVGSAVQLADQTVECSPIRKVLDF